jgi:hypothetical protein
MWTFVLPGWTGMILFRHARRCGPQTGSREVASDPHPRSRARRRGEASSLAKPPRMLRNPSGSAGGTDGSPGIGGAVGTAGKRNLCSKGRRSAMATSRAGFTTRRRGRTRGTCYSPSRWGRAAPSFARLGRSRPSSMETQAPIRWGGCWRNSALRGETPLHRAPTRLWCSRGSRRNTRRSRPWRGGRKPPSISATPRPSVPITVRGADGANAAQRRSSKRPAGRDGSDSLRAALAGLDAEFRASPRTARPKERPGNWQRRRCQADSMFAKRPRARCAARTQTQAKLAAMVRPGQASGAKMRIILGFLTVKGSLCPQFPPRLMTARLTRAIQTRWSMPRAEA